MFSSSFVSSAASGGRDRVDVVDRAAVEARRPPRSRPRRCRRRSSASSSSCSPSRPGSTRSGEKARWKSLAGLQAAALLEDRPEHLARRARVGRRLEHDEVALAEVRRDRRGRRARCTRRPARAGGESGVGTAITIASASATTRVVGRRGDRARLDERLQLLRGDVLDVALAAVDRVDDLVDDVDEDDLLAGLGEGLGERHADVAGADDGDVVASSSFRRAKRTERPRCGSAACPSP